MKIALRPHNQETLRGIAARRRQTGQVLMQLVVLFVVSMILIAGAIRLAGMVFSSQKSSSILSQMDTLQTAVDNTYENSPYGFNNLTAANIANSDQLPASQMIGTPPAATGLQDVYHSSIYLDPGAINGSPVDNAYTMTFEDIPEGACTKIVTQDMGPSIQNITVAAAGADPGFIAPASPTIERLPSATAQADCSNPSNMVSFTIVP